MITLLVLSYFRHHRSLETPIFANQFLIEMDEMNEMDIEISNVLGNGGVQCRSQLNLVFYMLECTTIKLRRKPQVIIVISVILLYG